MLASFMDKTNILQVSCKFVARIFYTEIHNIEEKKI